MVYIPFTDTQWLVIEMAFRDNHPQDKRKKLPIREVADWFSKWIIEYIPEEPPARCFNKDQIRLDDATITEQRRDSPALSA